MATASEMKAQIKNMDKQKEDMEKKRLKTELDMKKQLKLEADLKQRRLEKAKQSSEHRSEGPAAAEKNDLLI